MIQALLFMAGINTLLQTWFGTRLPTVMGPSFAYVLPVLSIIRDYSDNTFSSEHEVRKFFVDYPSKWSDDTFLAFLSYNKIDKFS